MKKIIRFVARLISTPFILALSFLAILFILLELVYPWADPWDADGDLISDRIRDFAHAWIKLLK